MLYLNLYSDERIYHYNKTHHMNRQFSYILNLCKFEYIQMLREAFELIHHIWNLKMLTAGCLRDIFQ